MHSKKYIGKIQIFTRCSTNAFIRFCLDLESLRLDFTGVGVTASRKTAERHFAET